MIIIIAASVYRLAQDSNTDIIHIGDKTQTPEFTGINLLNTTYDENGTRSYRVYSDKMEYFSQTGKSYFDNPMMYIYREGETIEWKVTAKMAS